MMRAYSRRLAVTFEIEHSIRVYCLLFILSINSKHSDLARHSFTANSASIFKSKILVVNRKANILGINRRHKTVQVNKHKNS